MTFLSSLSAEISAAFPELGTTVGKHHVRPSLIDGYDFQSDLAFRAAAARRIPPLQAAEDAKIRLLDSPLVSHACVSGKGFLNVRIEGAVLADALRAMVDDPHLQVPQDGSGVTAVMDFGGPNICKRLHAGHLRSFVIGESLRRLLSATGWRTVSDIHLGDWGLPVGMAVHAAASQGADLDALDVEAVERLYVDGAASATSEDGMAAARATTAALHRGDPDATRAWKKLRDASLRSFVAAADGFGAHFDELLGESDVHHLIGGMLEDLRSKGLLTEEDGALLVKDAPEGLPPVVLVKGDGAVTYAATDLATILDRKSRFSPGRIVYCVDRRQSGHFRSVFHVARLASYDGGAALEHAGFGTVNGKDGKPLKTRDGGAPKLDDLVAMAVEAVASRGQEDAATTRSVAMAALKYADLSGDRMTGYGFDPERMTAAEGRTGPYIQYADVRLRSIARKASSAGIEPVWTTLPEVGQERQLAVECLGWPDAVASAASGLQPGILSDKAFLLCQAFSRFYSAAPVLQGGDEAPLRLALCHATQVLVARSLDLLGIEPVERM